ncbi:MerR family transcriptional regulator [Actinocorallia sp. A-T 12471]|uniref:MerR family transcriptional regulator n=1 Tax=Actinocorallia sp. A-T 12471 TaxID=3089813 RepID=UPI0029CCE51E|nr:MerR family transcriptional regulator [Actinocorallia sp. A-T 12471]MDX6740340.1 MerR family transcriptional regulator [Actinocorallia sp. A-T 12471]
MEGPGLSVGAVARRLGVSASTLRTWDRRYGIGPSRRSEGSHRRYSAEDVTRLEVMNRLILEGAPPGEAARVALGVPAPAAPRKPRGHGAGGRRVPLPDGSARTRGLARAAMAMNGPAVLATVREALAEDGVVAAWQGVLAPVLRGIGERYAATGEAVEVEHFLSALTLACLAERAEPVDAANVRPVLLACAPEEQHSLPLYALAAALAETGVAARNLGMRVPEKALGDAIERTGPSVVFVWSQMRFTGDTGVLERLPVGRPPLRVLVGGPGWRLPLPERVRYVGTLGEAVEAVHESLGLVQPA